MIPYTDSPEDLQRIVDTVVRGLASQDWEQSRYAARSNCAIRGYAERKCAVGQLLPDGLYEKTGEDIDRVFRLMLGVCSYGRDSTMRERLVEKLREAHDQGYHPPMMAENVRSVVNFFGLKWPEDVA